MEKGFKFDLLPSFMFANRSFSWWSTSGPKAKLFTKITLQNNGFVNKQGRANGSQVKTHNYPQNHKSRSLRAFTATWETAKRCLSLMYSYFHLTKRFLLAQWHKPPHLKHSQTLPTSLHLWNVEGVLLRRLLSALGWVSHRKFQHKNKVQNVFTPLPWWDQTPTHLQ